MCLRQIDVNVVLFADRSIVSAKESIDRYRCSADISADPLFSFYSYVSCIDALFHKYHSYRVFKLHSWSKYPHRPDVLETFYLFLKSI